LTLRADKSEYFAGTARNELSECHSNVAEIEQALAAVARVRLVLLVEVGDIVHADGQPAILHPGDVAAARVLQLRLPMLGYGLRA
jgi:hypothetical protein